MNILKSLHQNNLLASTRGPKGGYRLQARPEDVSLYDLIEILDGPVQMTECTLVGQPGRCKVHHACPVQAPILALHHKLVRFLRDVKLSDVVSPGKRIDVPWEYVGAKTDTRAVPLALRS